MHPAPDDQCWSLEKNKKSRPERMTSTRKETERMFTSSQMEQITKALKAKTAKAKKHKLHEQIRRQFGFWFGRIVKWNKRKYHVRDSQHNEQIQKQRWATHIELLVTLVSPNKDSKPVRCLLDTGTTTTRSIVLSHYTSFSQHIHKKKQKTKWQTLRKWFVDNTKNSRYAFYYTRLVH